MITGLCEPRFEPVRSAFARNFAEHGELGAAVCVTHRGEVVVDLVGGTADAEDGRPWTADTIVMVWSCTKGALALCVHGAAGLGLLALDDPVCRYWPQFGKRDITVAMLLNHQAGLPGLAEPLPPRAVFEWEEMTGRLAAEAPYWEPGTRHGYHSFTFGWLAGEVLRRATATPPGAFFREQVAEPLGLDFFIGLPASEDRRVARVLMAPPPGSGPPSPFSEALAGGGHIQAAVMNSWGAFADPQICEQRAARAATVPAANGITNARGLALLYMPLALGTPVGGLRLGEDSLRRMRAVQSASLRDAVVLTPTRFSSGFQKATLHRRGWDVFAIPEAAFGHTGYGGSCGYADPDDRLSVGYVMNRHAAPGDSVRRQSLIDAVYRSLGYRDVP